MGLGQLAALYSHNSSSMKSYCYCTVYR